MADPADFSFDEVSGVSEDDKREILAEIERVASEHHIKVSDDVFRFSATRSGALFPVLVNVIGIALLAGGIFALAWFFRAEEADLRAAGQVVVTAESRLIEEIRKETEEQLAAKEDEIAGIQAQLESINREREELVATIEERVASREIELRQQYQADLQAERERLAALNLSEEEIEQRLSAFAETKQREYDQRLAQFRQESEAERQELEDELNQLESQFSRTLEEANAERETLIYESEARLAEMQDEFESQLAASEAELSAAEAELSRLARDQEQVELIRGQIRGLYEAISEALDESDYAAARGRLRDLRTLLNEENTLRIEELRDQRPTELFLISALESLTSYQERFSNPETLQRLSDASLVQRVADLAAEAAAAADGGDPDRAALLYDQALAVIPAVAESSEYLGAQTDTQSAQELSRINEAGEIAYRDAVGSLEAGEYLQAVERFAAVLSSYSRSRYRQPAIDGIERAVAELVTESEASIGELTERIVEREESIDELQTSVRDLETLQTQTAATLADQQALYQETSVSLEGVSEEAAQLSERVASLDAERESTARQLERARATLETREGELTAARTELADTLADLGAAQAALTQAQAQVSQLTADLARAEAQTSQLTADLELAREIGSVSADGGVTIDEETARELARLRTLRNDVELAQSSYTDYRESVASLPPDATVAEVLAAKVAFESFLGQEEVRDIFPELASEVGRFESSYLESGSENAILDLSDLLVEISLAESADERARIVSSARAERVSAAFDEFADELLTIVSP